MAKTSVGGQAVMEGVMMRAPDGIALAVRKGQHTRPPRNSGRRVVY